MKRLNLIIPKSVDKVMKEILLTVQTWANSAAAYVDTMAIPASRVEVQRGSFYTGVIDWPEWFIDLALPTEDYTTTGTTYKRCSGVWLWDSDKYPAGDWYFEASIAIQNAGATVSARLMGDGTALKTLSKTGDTSMQIIRSATPIVMPEAMANLYVEIKTSNATYQAALGNARLIFVPN